MNQLRVLVAAQQLRRRVPGGVGRAAVQLLGAMQPSQGVDLTLWASRPSPGAPGSGEVDDPLGSLGWRVKDSPLPGPLLTRAWDLGLLSAPAGFDGFDLVHAVSLAAPPPASPTAKRGQQAPGGRRARTTVPQTVTVHDVAWRHLPESSTARGRRWHDSALRRALRRGAHLVAPTARVAGHLLEGGAPSSAISVVRWGTDHLPEPDTDAAQQLLERIDVSGQYLLAVGTLEPRKNLTRVIQAYQAVRDGLPEPWPLVVVGPKGWGSIADSLRTERPAGVHLTGGVPDPVLTGLYDRARLLVYVPLQEGFGFPPVEALSRGLPCVASQEVPSVAGDAWKEPVAILADPYQIESIGQGMLSAATDEGLRRQLIKSGREMCAAYTWHTAAANYVALWRELVP